MKKVFAVLGVLCLVLAISGIAYATNGDVLIGIGPIARAMGGVGIAAPQDAISAIFANPAAMCFGAYCPGSEFNFAGTLFRPKPEAKVSAGGVTATQPGGTSTRYQRQLRSFVRIAAASVGIKLLTMSGRVAPSRPATRNVKP